MRMPCHITDERIENDPQNAKDDARPVRTCVICDRQMHRSDSYATTEWIDAQTEANLEDAGKVPSGLICSKKCASQALFEALGAEQQKALQTIILLHGELDIAFRSLGVGLRKMHSLVAPFMDESSFQQCASALDDCYELLVSDDPPAWADKFLSEKRP